MNKETGAIAQFETLQDARAAGFKHTLTPEQAVELRPLPRPERRFRYAQMVEEERRAKKAKRRAQREARRANRR
jgi:hypothetical protein